MNEGLFLCVVLGLPCFCLSAEGNATERCCDFCQPQAKHVVIHEGQVAEGHCAYNHMASVERFDGRFQAVWGAHDKTHLEGKPGQVNVWAMTADFERWSAPRKLAHTGPGALPVDPQCVQWPPNTFPNPILYPAPRLYLDDGFEVDYVSSLAGSEFLEDLGSLRSRVRHPGQHEIRSWGQHTKTTN